MVICHFHGDVSALTCNERRCTGKFGFNLATGRMRRCDKVVSLETQFKAKEKSMALTGAWKECDMKP
jgi:hypothetical protein